MHLAKPVELADNWERGSPVFVNPSEPNNGRFELPTAPGLGVQFDAVELEKRKIVIKF